MTETQRKAMQNALNSWAADLERGMQVFIPAATLRKIADVLEESVQQPVTDEENERFSQDVSDFSGADPEATKYALEQFLQNRAKAQQPVPTTPRSEPLTDKQIEAGRKATFSTSNPFCPCDSKTMRKAVRWAEHVHGIGAEQ